jgi:hypothetical protein
MFVPFDSMPGSARIWIYQSERKFSPAEIDAISSRLKSFTEQWMAHGNPLNTSFRIYHEQFIILAVDENKNDASGCSIDTSVKAIKEIERHLAVSLFNRTDVAFFVNNEVVITKLNDLSRRQGEGIWNRNTLVFDNTILLKGQMADKWIVPAGETWLRKYLNKVVV